MRSGRLGLSCRRRNRHQPLNMNMRKCRHRRYQLDKPVRMKTALRRLPSDIHLKQNILRLPGFSGAPINFLRKLQAVDRMNQLEHADNRSNFPPLQMSDKVPPNRRLCERLNLRKRFLHSIFSEDRQPCGDPLPNTINRDGFRSSDEPDALRAPPGLLCGRPNC